MSHRKEERSPRRETPDQYLLHKRDVMHGYLAAATHLASASMTLQLAVVALERERLWDPWPDADNEKLDDDRQFLRDRSATLRKKAVDMTKIALIILGNETAEHFDGRRVSPENMPHRLDDAQLVEDYGLAIRGAAMEVEAANLALRAMQDAPGYLEADLEAAIRFLTIEETVLLDND